MSSVALLVAAQRVSGWSIDLVEFRRLVAAQYARELDHTNPLKGRTLLDISCATDTFENSACRNIPKLVY
jgi:hypothetical protein